jgi:hypothetical protein
MSRTFHNGERRIRVRGIRKDPPDLRRLARALIALAEAQAETEARAEDTRLQRSETKPPNGQQAESRVDPKSSDEDAA